MSVLLDKNLGRGFMTTNGNTFAITTTNTPAIGSQVYVALELQDSATCTVSDSAGNTYTQVGSNVIAGDGMAIALFKATITNALVSGSTITINLSSTQVRALANAASFTGSDNGTPDVALSGNTGFNSTSVVTNAITTLTAGDLVLAIIASSGAANASLGSISNGFTVLNSGSSIDSNNLVFLYKIGTTAGNAADGQTGGTWSVSQSGADNMQAIVAFKPSAGSVTNPLTLTATASETPTLRRVVNKVLIP